MNEDVFLKNLNSFLKENKESYIQMLTNENSEYKKVYKLFFSQIKIVEEKLPKNDNSLEKLISTFFRLSNIENLFLYKQGFKDYKKLRKIF